MVANFFDFIPEANKILKGFRAFAGITEKCGGMVECHYLGSIEIKPLTMLLGYAEIAFDEASGRYSAKADDDFGLEQFQLCGEPLKAGCLLFGERITVLGRTTLNCVGNIYILLRSRSIIASISSSSFPARPTKGSPCRSSCSPGPSPIKSTSALWEPTPNTTFVRVSQS